MNWIILIIAGLFEDLQDDVLVATFTRTQDDVIEYPRRVPRHISTMSSCVRSEAKHAGSILIEKYQQLTLLSSNERDPACFAALARRMTKKV